MDGPALKALAASGRPGDWSARSLPARCARLRLDLAAAGVEAGALDAAWPGGAETPKGRDAWQRCFARYQFLAGQRATAPAARPSADADRALRRAIAAAAQDKEQYVELSTGRVGVYPKSYHALEECDALDAAMARLTGIALVEASLLSDDDSAAALMYAPILRSVAFRAWAWIITTPGATLPADYEAADAPPAWTEALTPQDLLALWRAHREVNRDRLAIIGEAFPKTPGAAPSRLSVEGFLGAYAGDKGLDPLDVLRRWSLGRVYAVAVSEAITAEEARQRAEAERARERQAA